MNEGEFAARLGLVGVPTAAETIMLERDMRLVALTEGRYHAASLTCAEVARGPAPRQGAGLPVTASASINHLTLNEIDVGPYRTFLKVSPPLRAEDDRTALVAALASGLIDVVDVRPQPAGRRRQAPAVRRSERGRDRARDHAHGRPAPRPQRRAAAHDPDQGHVEPARRDPGPRRAERCGREARPMSS